MSNARQFKLALPVKRSYTYTVQVFTKKERQDIFFGLLQAISNSPIVHGSISKRVEHSDQALDPLTVVGAFVDEAKLWLNYEDKPRAAPPLYARKLIEKSFAASAPVEFNYSPP